MVVYECKNIKDFCFFFLWQEIFFLQWVYEGVILILFFQMFQFVFYLFILFINEFIVSLEINKLYVFFGFIYLYNNEVKIDIIILNLLN